MMDSARPTFDQQFPELLRLAQLVAYRILGDSSRAEDIALETVARAYVRWGRVEKYAPRWVSRVATNMSLDARRAEARRTAIPFPATVDAAPDSGGERTDLRDALRKLPRRQREVIVLRQLGDYSEAQVASALEISVSSVKQHHKRAVESLRRSLGETRPDQYEKGLPHHG